MHITLEMKRSPETIAVRKTFLSMQCSLQLSALCFQSRHVRSRAPANTYQFVIEIQETASNIFVNSYTIMFLIS